MPLKILVSYENISKLQLKRAGTLITFGYFVFLELNFSYSEPVLNI